MVMTHLSEQQLAQFSDLERVNPRARRLSQLIKEHAETEGGVTLQFFRIHMGRLWGLPHMSTADYAAAQLGIPLSEAEAIIGKTAEAVDPKMREADRAQNE